jgi:hypothetical protein
MRRQNRLEIGAERERQMAARGGNGSAQPEVRGHAAGPRASDRRQPRPAGCHPSGAAAPIALGRGRTFEGVQFMPSGPNFLLATLAEFARATAAAQRYDDLRYRSAGGIAPADIPRRVFEELYCSEQPGEVAPVQPASARFAEWPMRRRRGVA